MVVYSFHLPIYDKIGAAKSGLGVAWGLEIEAKSPYQKRCYTLCLSWQTIGKAKEDIVYSNRTLKSVIKDSSSFKV